MYPESLISIPAACRGRERNGAGYFSARFEAICRVERGAYPELASKPRLVYSLYTPTTQNKETSRDYASFAYFKIISATSTAVSVLALIDFVAFVLTCNAAPTIGIGVFHMLCFFMRLGGRTRNFP